MNEVSELCGVECTQTGVDEITIVGVSAHASTPEGGKNAGLAAMILATKLPLAACAQIDAIKAMLEIFPWAETDGAHLGIKMEDAESHALTCTPDLYHVDPCYVEVKFDSRTPVMATKENCQDAAEKTAHAHGFDFETPGMIPPHRVAADSEFVQKLLRAYEQVTGLKGEAMAIGGGTYVHDIKNGVAFGAVLPGIDTHMHGADEFFDLENIVLATKVYAEAIIELCS